MRNTLRPGIRKSVNILSVDIDMQAYLNWIESQGDEVITNDSIRMSSAMSDIRSFDPIQVSNELWSWLNITLGNNVHANRQFNLAGELNGAEAYRRLVAPQVVNSLIRRNALRDKIQSPQRAKNMISIMDYVSLWEENTEAFIKAGGSPVAEEDRCAQLMKILPAGLSFEIMSKADDESKRGSAKLITWMRDKSKFIAEYAPGKGEVNVMAQPPPEPFDNSDDDDSYDDDNITAKDVRDMDDQELLALVRRGGNFGGNTRGRLGGNTGGNRQAGRTGGQRPGGQRAGGRVGGPNNRRFGNGGQPPPRDRQDLRCINCGGKDHSWRACPMPEVPRDQRPCLRCLKPGHLSADCPLNKGAKGSAALIDGAAGDQPPRTYEIRCVEAEGGKIGSAGNLL